jgi:anti-sigma-K factor RskA
MDALLPAHPALRQAVQRWQERLEPLAASVPPVEPSERVWRGIEARLWPAPTGAAPMPWWRRVAPWRALAGAATVAALALFVVVQQPAPAAPPIVIVLGAPGADGAAVPARFVASISPDGRALVLRPLDAPALTAQQVLELWAVPASGAPRSLGLVKADAATTLLRDQLLRDTAALAVSVEPPGGSPTGAPTGPIVSLGQVPI